jgi:predicted RNA-binding protein with PUA-like domain
MSAWLFKTEPSEYSFADLVRDRTTTWSGVKNATALIHLRKIAKGDTVVIYHTGTERNAVGLAKVSRGAYPDPALKDPKRVVVDLAAGAAFKAPVPLAAFRADPVLATTDLIRITRLSIVPLDARQMARVMALGRG